LGEEFRHSGKQKNPVDVIAVSVPAIIAGGAITHDVQSLLVTALSASTNSHSVRSLHPAYIRITLPATFCQTGTVLPVP
jgi:hypothetical protein